MSTLASPLSRELTNNGVVVVSSNYRLRRELLKKLKRSSLNLIEAESGADALDKLTSEACDLVLLDPVLQDLDPVEFGSLLKTEFPGLQLITINSHTGQPSLRTAGLTELAREVIEILESGSPLQIKPLNEATTDDKSEPGLTSLPGMLGASEAIRQVGTLVKQVALRDATVTITGESGTGKDLVAHAIHLLSGRSKGPFVAINCAAIPEALLEAELFGYMKGAFTGAVQARIGRIHAAHGGTLFLDEIGEMPLPLQSKLLRVLEQGELQRLGSSDNFKIDVRVVAATNADLRFLMKQKLFREDLYFRLSIFPISLPPLRDRMTDVPILAVAFAHKFAPLAVVTTEALSILQGHTWPGNVRELKNVMERASILIGTGSEIRAEHILL